MTEPVLSAAQREILDALAGRWELLWWRCNDGRQRWHMGEGEVDGRAVRGLVRRGLIVPGGDDVGGQLVLAARAETDARRPAGAAPGAGSEAR